MIHFEMMSLFFFLSMFFCFILFFASVSGVSVLALAYHLSLQLTGRVRRGCPRYICNAFVTNMRKPRNGGGHVEGSASGSLEVKLRNAEGTEEG